jgi:type III secretion system low calcium response chaperone LcrH/SycD
MTELEASNGVQDEIVTGAGMTAEGQRMLAILEGGGAIRDVIGLSAADLEGAYAIGVNLAEHAKYEKAEPMLQFACLGDHREPRYWLALGKCRQALKNYAGAVDAYVMGNMIDGQDPQPIMESAVCYLAVGHKDAAREALALADEAVAAKPDEAARQRIAALRHAL